jgi:nitrate/TMAO reductase-like tetraheme cytochrome c subunit
MKDKTSIKAILMQKKVVYAILVLVLIAAGGMAAMAKVSDQPEFCASCHNMQKYYDSWHDGKLLASSHGKAGVKCHDCHTASMAQQIEEGISYITNDYDDPMKKRQFPNENCTKCHDMDKVKAKTVFADKKGPVNPHDAHVGEQNCYECHSMHQESLLSCTECHTPQWMNKLPDYWKKTK